MNASVNKSLDKVKDLVVRSKVPSITTLPQISLQKGNWVKLICGASFEVIYVCKFAAKFLFDCYCFRYNRFRPHFSCIVESCFIASYFLY